MVFFASAKEILEGKLLARIAAGAHSAWVAAILTEQRFEVLKASLLLILDVWTERCCHRGFGERGVVSAQS